LTPELFLALSPLGERVARAGAFFSRGGTGEGVARPRPRVGPRNVRKTKNQLFRMPLPALFLGLIPGGETAPVKLKLVGKGGI